MIADDELDDAMDWGDDDYDDSYEVIGSCDECECDLTEDDCYHRWGLQLCGQCYWRASH